MLNMLEGWDLSAMGFDSPERLHLLAEVIRIGFEDRRAASGDPDFVDIPVERLVSKSYAENKQQQTKQAKQANQGKLRKTKENKGKLKKTRQNCKQGTG